MTQQSCPLCMYGAGGFTRALIVYEDQAVIVVPSLHQKRRNHGHCLVITREHVPNIYALSDTLAGPVLQAVAAAARATKKAFTADGISIRQNNDPAGGQDVFHVHFHVVPRFEGDDFDVAEYQQLSELTRIDQAEAMRRMWKSPA
jgi:diadenosine tetraphosphate (Ap4A) HIT family hydrolase